MNHLFRRHVSAQLVVALLVALQQSAAPAFAQDEVPALAEDRTPALANDAERAAVDESIRRALEYLAGQQLDSHAWKIDAYGESTAATSLAVMAFLAAGHIPGEGPYGQRITNGVGWVLDHQAPNGLLIHKRSHGPFYSHGISTLMLAEVSGMLDESLADRCDEVLEKAVAVILQAQLVNKPDRHAGGWRYQITSRDSDLSVTAWQLLALRAARNIGCDVPAEAIDRAVDYVTRCQSGDDTGFAYQPGSAATATRNGTGILALEICGQHRAPVALRAAESLLKTPLQESDSYFYYGAYYTSVGTFQLGGKYWDATRKHVRDILLQSQNKDGSWRSTRGGEQTAGPIYSTALAVLALAVEYQYLPIYQR